MAVSDHIQSPQTRCIILQGAEQEMAHTSTGGNLSETSGAGAATSSFCSKPAQTGSCPPANRKGFPDLV